MGSSASSCLIYGILVSNELQDKFQEKYGECISDLVYGKFDQGNSGDARTGEMELVIGVSICNSDEYKVTAMGQVIRPADFKNVEKLFNFQDKYPELKKLKPQYYLCCWIA